MYPIYNKVENAIGTYLYMQYYAKKDKFNGWYFCINYQKIKI